MTRTRRFFTSIVAVLSIVTGLTFIGSDTLALAVLFWYSIAVALLASGLIFRDLADLSQWVLGTSREDTTWTWYNRAKVLGVAFIGISSAVVIKVFAPTVVGWIPLGLILIIFSMLIFAGYINPLLMMRGRQKSGRFVSAQEAGKYIADDESVIVVEINGAARAHADKEVLRPHVAGNGTLGGENVVMTYCGLTNLGVAVTPEIDGETLELRPMTQLNNNLLMVDEKSGEPVQQLWLKKESDISANIGPAMKEWPTFRMPFSKFVRAYPEGEVFINDYKAADMKPGFLQNPFFALYDPIMEMVFTHTINKQMNDEAPVFPTIVHSDKRLNSKEKVWAFNIGEEYVAYTEAFVRAHHGPINATVGGKPIVVSYSDEYQSLGIYYNTTEHPIDTIDFSGLTPLGKMSRVETVKAGAYWIVWAHWYPNTDVNRIGTQVDTIANSGPNISKDQT
jgi:hypothetical protein